MLLERMWIINLNKDIALQNVLFVLEFDFNSI